MPRWPTVIALLLVVTLSGCSLGYRYHHLGGSMENAAGANAQIEGAGHTFVMSTVLDFRYARLLTSYLFPSYTYELVDDAGGSGHHSSKFETRGFQLDAPVVSFWSEDDETTIGYPGRMEHRQSLELWLSGSSRVDVQPSAWADVGLVYYHHNLFAARLFAGWGTIAIDDSTSRLASEGTEQQFWDTDAGGLTAGFDVTFAAGEHALDFLKFFVDAQDEAGKPPD